MFTSDDTNTMNLGIVSSLTIYVSDDTSTTASEIKIASTTTSTNYTSTVTTTSEVKDIEADKFLLIPKNKFPNIVKYIYPIIKNYTKKPSFYRKILRKQWSGKNFKKIKGNCKNVCK